MLLLLQERCVSVINDDAVKGDNCSHLHCPTAVAEVGAGREADAIGWAHWGKGEGQMTLCMESDCKI